MSKTNARAQSEQLFNLQVLGDKYARLLVEQKHRLRQLDDHWKKVHEELKELRLKRGESDQRGGGVNAVRTRMADEQRELMKLENRLSACKTRESKMAAYNAELRNRVDELRANRVLSQTVFEKNQRRLRDIQKQMQETFRQSTQIVGERDRILSQANSLSGQNMDEQEAFDQVYQSLASIIKREKESAEAYRKQILEQDPMDLSDDFVRGNMKLEDELQLKKTLQKLDMTMLEDKQNIASINEKLQEFETTFAALQQEMGVDDYHELVEVYSRKEEENFALFRYVQSTNNEVEQLEDEKLALEREIQKLKNEMQDSSANARKRMVDDLVETRQNILKENAEIERLRAAAAREFQPLARVVDRLYNALGCNDVMPPVVGASTSGNGSDASKRTRKQSEDQLAMVARINSMNDLLAAQGITEGNILQFLAIIEQRSNDLIEQFSRRIQYKNPAEAQRASLGANLRPSDPTRSVNAVRALLPDFLEGPTNSSGYGATSSPLATSPLQFTATGSSTGGMSIDFSLDRQLSVNTSIAEDEPESPRSDDEDGDRPLTRLELQKRAAKSFASLQASPKLQPIRAKPVLSKKKKY
ncbi:hypothetical protein PC129_g1697 [Phytophthora cactorum]|uniref:ODAD1 central coiled coil region domain-containing protein n=1 Tax=Phytophthora cactorum TaxID=29920 RepID=A0A329T4K8_9STRA|nr:hypothetical protein Pcac1_g2616 [Phytophthora cactorum]KAG2840629.1 hypothetical protein PC112_g3674 [Phytophthora cactorum]KAG2842238.1 hypothetical protein PC111_g2794 [Phytophthora cactorum]KAG2869176.1 hypothetical protein PC113_g437 [Phytophthora cactorum]KAG2924706.1 hypothetical protein PC114_g4387 [Phytophthora cactorum]